MIDILHETSLLSYSLKARGTGLFRAENLIKRSIKAFELLKDNMGRYKKEIDEKVASDAFKENLLKITDLLAYLVKCY